MVEDDEYGCTGIEVVAGACCLTEDGCLAVAGLIAGVCCFTRRWSFGSTTSRNWSWLLNR